MNIIATIIVFILSIAAMIFFLTLVDAPLLAFCFMIPIAISSFILFEEVTDRWFR